MPIKYRFFNGNYTVWTEFINALTTVNSKIEEKLKPIKDKKIKNLNSIPLGHFKSDTIRISPIKNPLFNNQDFSIDSFFDV